MATREPRGGAHTKMDSVLSVLAMVGCMLILGWLVGSGDEQGTHERPQEEPLPERSRAEARPFEER